MPHWIDINTDFADTPAIIDEKEFLDLIETGRACYLNRAFLWASTKEGHSFWNNIAVNNEGTNPILPPSIMERIKEIYVEAKLLA